MPLPPSLMECDLLKKAAWRYPVDYGQCPRFVLTMTSAKTSRK